MTGIALGGRRGRVLGWSHEPRLDAELAERQAFVRAELHGRPREQREFLGTRVLEQVAGQFGHERILVVGEPCVVLRGQVHGVLVGDIGLRHGHGAMLLHFAHELASDLDRPHLGAEGAAERALDEAGDLAFKALEYAHPDGPSARAMLVITGATAAARGPHRGATRRPPA